MRYAYVNGQYAHHMEAMVHIEDRGYQFSDGVYEYIAFYNKKLVDGEPHLRRLERSVRELEIPMPMSGAAMLVVIRELIHRNGRPDGGLYIQVTRGVARRDHGFPKNTKPALVMTTCEAKLPKPQQVKDGVAAVTQPDIRWGRRDIKSISLLPNILAKQKAVEAGAREAWLVDGDIITEGSASNAYIVTKVGELVTHPANEFILGGITREAVLSLARLRGIPVVERAMTLHDVREAAEAFITSTSANVLPVVTIDGRPVGSGRPGAISMMLNELYCDHIFAQTGKRI